MGEVIAFVVMDLAFRCLVGCASVQGPVPELRLPPKRIEQIGYSVAPLNDAGWRLFVRTPTQLVLGKVGPNADETMTIQAGTYKVSDMDDPRLMQRAGAEVGERFRVLEWTSAPDQRAGCTRRHLVTEDRLPMRRSGGTASMILEAAMLTCVHPDDANLGVALMYSRRYDPGRRDPAFDANAAGVLEGLRLTATPAAKEEKTNAR
jgi:hypothetical protein